VYKTIGLNIEIKEKIKPYILNIPI
jgi:hypothetical protein